MYLMDLGWTQPRLDCAFAWPLPHLLTEANLRHSQQKRLTPLTSWWEDSTVQERKGRIGPACPALGWLPSAPRKSGALKCEKITAGSLL